MATGTIISVTDDGYFHTVKVRVTEADGSLADYTIELASSLVALLSDANKREFLRLSVKAQRDKRLATTLTAASVPISGELAL